MIELIKDNIFLILRGISYFALGILNFVYYLKISNGGSQSKLLLLFFMTFTMVIAAGLSVYMIYEKEYNWKYFIEPILFILLILGQYIYLFFVEKIYSKEFNEKENDYKKKILMRAYMINGSSMLLWLGLLGLSYFFDNLTEDTSDNNSSDDNNFSNDSFGDNNSVKNTFDNDELSNNQQNTETELLNFDTNNQTNSNSLTDTFSNQEPMQQQSLNNNALLNQGQNQKNLVKSKSMLEQLMLTPENKIQCSEPNKEIKCVDKRNPIL